LGLDFEKETPETNVNSTTENEGQVESNAERHVVATACAQQLREDLEAERQKLAKMTPEEITTECLEYWNPAQYKFLYSKVLLLYLLTVC
jgi:hypothetical protein